jgi:hypothetical protein
MIMKIYMTKKGWDNWVDTTYRKACDFIAENPYVTGQYVHERLTTDSPMKHIYYLINANTGRIGIAKCNTEDEFVHEVGVAIAYSRYMNLPIPRITEEVDVTEIKIGDTVMLDDVYTYCGYYRGEHQFARVGSTTISKTVKTYMGITFRRVVD